MSHPQACAPAAAPVIALERLQRRYGERVALSELTLTLERGQTLVVFGPNGAGKTTLLRVLATLLRPHGGVARLFGSQLPGDAWRVRGRVGLLAHEPLLYRELTPRENLTFHARLHGVDEQRVQTMLDALGLRDRAGEPLRTLSRGMVQRVAIARAVLHDPELLLLDEPRANLDPQAGELAEPFIGRDGERTRVLSSHDPQAGLQEADWVLGLRAGRPVLFGAAASIDPDEVRGLYR